MVSRADPPPQSASEQRRWRCPWQWTEIDNTPKGSQKSTCQKPSQFISANLGPIIRPHGNLKLYCETPLWYLTYIIYLHYCLSCIQCFEHGRSQYREVAKNCLAKNWQIQYLSNVETFIIHTQVSFIEETRVRSVSTRQLGIYCFFVSSQVAALKEKSTALENEGTEDKKRVLWMLIQVM